MGTSRCDWSKSISICSRRGGSPVLSQGHATKSLLLNAASVIGAGSLSQSCILPTGPTHGPTREAPGTKPLSARGKPFALRTYGPLFRCIVTKAGANCDLWIIWPIQDQAQACWSVRDISGASHSVSQLPAPHSGTPEVGSPHHTVRSSEATSTSNKARAIHLSIAVAPACIVLRSTCRTACAASECS